MGKQKSQLERKEGWGEKPPTNQTATAGEERGSHKEQRSVPEIIASKETGPQSYNCKELNLANMLSEPGGGYMPRASRKGYSSAFPYYSLVRFQAESLDVRLHPDFHLHNQMIDGYCFIFGINHCNREKNQIHHPMYTPLSFRSGFDLLNWDTTLCPGLSLSAVHYCLEMPGALT